MTFESVLKGLGTHNYLISQNVFTKSYDGEILFTCEERSISAPQPRMKR